MLDSFTFTLDTDGNITQVTHADGTKWVYTYDNRDRLTAGNLQDSGSNNLRAYGYTYDAAGNLTAKTRTVTSPASSISWALTYDNANELLTFTPSNGTTMTNAYDAWGRISGRTQGSSSSTYNYRYGGKLYNYTTNFAGETTETMQYRGDGRMYSRAWGSTTKVYRYDAGWNVINEENGTGTLQYTNVYSPGSSVGERMAWVAGTMSSGTWNYAYRDQLGSTRRWRNASKALTATDDFGPYGEGITTSTATPYDYALHEFDSNTAGYRSAYRLYSSGFARWTTRDPLGMVNGPNVYGYVRSQPINSLDRLGAQACNNPNRPCHSLPADALYDGKCKKETFASESKCQDCCNKEHNEATSQPPCLMDQLSCYLERNPIACIGRLWASSAAAASNQDKICKIYCNETYGPNPSASDPNPDTQE